MSINCEFRINKIQENGRRRHLNQHQSLRRCILSTSQCTLHFVNKPMHSRCLFILIDHIALTYSRRPRRTHWADAIEHLHGLPIVSRVTDWLSRHRILTPLESRKRMAAWYGSSVPSDRRPRVAPREARRFSNSAEALRMCAPELSWKDTTRKEPNIYRLD